VDADRRLRLGRRDPRGMRGDDGGEVAASCRSERGSRRRLRRFIAHRPQRRAGSAIQRPRWWPDIDSAGTDVPRGARAMPDALSSTLPCCSTKICGRSLARGRKKCPFPCLMIAHLWYSTLQIAYRRYVHVPFDLYLRWRASASSRRRRPGLRVVFEGPRPQTSWSKGGKVPEWRDRLRNSVVEPPSGSLQCIALSRSQ
jgi:hypothetical protein